MRPEFAIILLGFAYGIAIIAALLANQHHHGIQCHTCRNRRRLVRWGTLGIIAVAIALDHTWTFSDVAFFGLALHVEVFG